MFTDPLPTNGRSIVARVCFRGNVFTESLPSDEYTCHNIIYTLNRLRQLDLSFLVVGHCVSGFKISG
jgi:hypothetical protein